MSDLEQRITETLAAHPPIRPWSDAGVMKCRCGERFIAEYGHQQQELHRVHQATALAPVIWEAQREAFDLAADCAPEYMPPNPYRSNDE